MKISVNENCLCVTIHEKMNGLMISDCLSLLKISLKKQNTLFHEKRIFNNDKNARLNEHVFIGDCIKVSNEEEIDFVADEKEACVVYEDDFVLIVNKEEGIIIHPDDKTVNGTLANQVAAYYKRSNQHHFIRPLHRLDADTKGLVMFSKCSLLQPFFDEQFSSQTVYREYHAIVFGKMTTKRTIHRTIGKDRHQNNRFRITNSGKEAITIVTPLTHNDKYSCVKCELITGRTHQIRVHLSSTGFPIVNDSFYGKKSDDYIGMGLACVGLCWNNIYGEKQSLFLPLLEL